MSEVCAVVGGQYGSEGKGHVVARLALEYNAHVRVGGANAGHTFYVHGGTPDTVEKHVVQQLPVAAYANPVARLYIGPGAVISADVLSREIDENVAWRQERQLPRLELGIDHRAHLVCQKHKTEEDASGLADRIGSTSATAREGIGAATAARVMRDPDRCFTATAWASTMNWAGAERRWLLVDVPQQLRREPSILLEGTQGYGLSLTTGDFPYVTSRNTTTAGLLADCGLPPQRLTRVVVVMRTYPIRVAGNSGPFHHDSYETKWGHLGVDPETERTTVTKKIRRVATFSYEQAKEAIEVNGGTEVALMFADYTCPSLRGVWGIHRDPSTVPGSGAGMFELELMVQRIERWAPVTMVGTGPWTMITRPKTPKQSLTGMRLEP